jgi:hypothetical protein
MKSVIAWLQQPTTVAGLSALFGTLAALGLHEMSWTQALPLIAGSMMSIALPDNSGAKADAVDIVQNFLKQDVSASVPAPGNPGSRTTSR